MWTQNYCVYQPAAGEAGSQLTGAGATLPLPLLWCGVKCGDPLAVLTSTTALREHLALLAFDAADRALPLLLEALLQARVVEVIAAACCADRRMALIVLVEANRALRVTDRRQPHFLLLAQHRLDHRPLPQQLLQFRLQERLRRQQRLLPGIEPTTARAAAAATAAARAATRATAQTADGRATP